MLSKLNDFIDRLSEFIARRKGLLPTIGVLLILVNLMIQFIPWFGWFANGNILLHIGIIIAIIGFLLGWAL